MTPPSGGGSVVPGPWQPAVEQAWRRLHTHLVDDVPFVDLVDDAARQDRLHDRLARALRPVSAALVEVDAAAPPPPDRRHHSDVWWVRWDAEHDADVRRLISAQEGPAPPCRGLVVVGVPGPEPRAGAGDPPSLLDSDEVGTGPPAAIAGSDASVSLVVSAPGSTAAPAGGPLDIESLRESLLFAYSMARLGETETALKRALVATDAAFSWPDGPAADESRAAALTTLARVESLAGDHAAAIDHTTTLVRLPGAARYIDRGIVGTMVDLAGRVHDPRSLLELADELEPFLTLACEAFDEQQGSDATVEVRAALALLYERTADACETLGELVRAEGLRRRALQLREQELARNPDSLTALLDAARTGNALGRLLLTLGRDETKPIFERALELRRRQVALTGESVSSRRDLAGSYVFLGDALARDDDPLAAAFYEEAVALDRDVLAESGHDPEGLDALSTGLGRLARERRRRGRLREAHAYAAEVLAARRAAVITDDRPELLRNLKVALGDLAAVERDLGHLDECTALRDEALDVARRLFEISPEWALAVDDLAVALAMAANDCELRGDLDGALALLAEASEHCDRYLATTGRTTRALDLVASSAVDRARVLRDLGRHDEEEALHLQAVACRREAVEIAGPTPERRQALAQALNSTATTLRRRHGPGAAEPVFTEAVGIFRDLLETTDRTPGRYRDLAMCLINLGNTHLDRHDVETAEEIYSEALRLQREALERFEPTPSSRRALTLAAANVALARARLGSLAEGIELMRESLAERQALLRDGTTSPRGHAVIVAAVNLAALDARAGRPGDAAVAIEAGRSTLSVVAADGADRPGVLEVSRGLAWAEGLVAFEAGEPERAEPPLARAVALARRHVEAVAAGHSARCGLAGALTQWTRAVLDATVPTVDRLEPAMPFAELKGRLQAAVAEVVPIVEELTGPATDATAAPLADVLVLAARLALADGDLTTASTTCNRAVALLSTPRGERPEVDHWRCVLEARTVALQIAIAAADPARTTRLADALPALADHGRATLGEAVAIHRSAIAADLAVAAWAQAMGLDDRAGAARRRAEAALADAEANFATPVAWARLRVALDSARQT